MRILVDLGVHGCETNERSLSSLNHGKPKDGNPDGNVCSDRVNIRGQSGVFLGDESHDTYHRKDEECYRVDTLEYGDGVHVR
jgi:hypothetical protein